MNNIPTYRIACIRDSFVRAEEVPALDRPSEVVKLAHAVIGPGEEREHFLVMYLDVRNKVKGCSVVSVGTLAASLVHPREFFRGAIIQGAAAVVAVHNHPSQDASPSIEDKATTKRLVEAGKLLGIPLVDHVIITEGDAYFSFRESGLL